MSRSLAVPMLVLAAVLGCAARASAQPPVTDPTAPPDRSVAGRVDTTRPPLLLQSTSVSLTSRSAVINSEIVTVGAVIEGARVMSIEPGTVTLRTGTETTVLRLIRAPIKQPSRQER